VRAVVDDEIQNAAKLAKDDLAQAVHVSLVRSPEQFESILHPPSRDVLLEIPDIGRPDLIHVHEIDGNELRGPEKLGQQDRAPPSPDADLENALRIEGRETRQEQRVLLERPPIPVQYKGASIGALGLLRPDRPDSKRLDAKPEVTKVEAPVVTPHERR
jgi:hypothetical protein